MFIKKIKNKQKKGFTVLELMISLGIMTLLMSITIANFRSFDHDQKLDGDFEVLAADIRQTQLMALTGQTISSNRHAYGVNFEVCSEDEVCEYRVFKNNLTGDKFYQENKLITGGTKRMTNGIYIGRLDVDGVSQSEVDIVFMPPFVTDDIYINNSQDDEELTVTLMSNNTNVEKSIVINRNTGQIKKQIVE
jgi:prepilin-type N-terminal cleavage/methylation domain-containing protein